MNTTDLLGMAAAQVIEIYGEKSLISQDELSEEDVRHIEMPSLGLAIVLENKQAECVQLFGEGADPEYSKFAGEIFGELRFTDSRTTVRSFFGSPAEYDNGGAGRGFLGDFLKPWDAFFIGQYRYHFEYSQDAERINLVSITTKTTPARHV
jgi:hypothetical protein